MKKNCTEAKIDTIDVAMFQTISDANEFLIAVQPELKFVSQQFYQGPSEDTWSSLESFLENMEWLTELLSFMVGNNTWADQRKVIESLIHELNENLLQLNQALMNNDCVLIADIIGYEFIPLFQKMSNCFISLCNIGEKQ